MKAEEKDLLPLFIKIKEQSEDIALLSEIRSSQSKMIQRLHEKIDHMKLQMSSLVPIGMSGQVRWEDNPTMTFYGLTQEQVVMLIHYYELRTGLDARKISKATD